MKQGLGNVMIVAFVWLRYQPKVAAYGECNTLECEHECVDGDTPYCKCYPGYEIINKNKCRDIDECASQPCDQICNNVLGSYNCNCKPEYIFTGAGNKCQARCPPPWKAFSGKCYGIFTCTFESDFCRPATAEEDCSQKGGRLVRVESEAINNLLESMATELVEAILIAGAQNTTTKTWEYDQATRMVYTNWAPGEPVVRATNSQICIGIYHHGGYMGKWFPYACSLHNHYTNAFACEKPWRFF